MERRGWLGTYGFYDACDFTRYGTNSAQVDRAGVPVACWMAHHQGMILVAAANALDASVMQRRFHAEPMVAATERLLQENTRTATDPGEDEAGGKLGWLRESVPVFRSFWQTALSAPRGESELPSAQRVRETDG
jgi:hypothetical protein